MIVRKTLLAASAAALMSTPAWAISSHANGHAPSTTPVGPPSSTPNNRDHGKSGNAPGHSGKSHKCKPHKVAFVVAGTLATETAGLTKNEDGIYSGELKIVVLRTNHHAIAEKEGTPPVEKTYTLTKVHVTFGLADTNGNGSVGLDDVKKGDSVKLIGKIEALAKKCDHTGFKAEKKINRVIFNAPAS